MKTQLSILCFFVATIANAQVFDTLGNKVYHIDYGRTNDILRQIPGQSYYYDDDEDKITVGGELFMKLKYKDTGYTEFNVMTFYGNRIIRTYNWDKNKSVIKTPNQFGLTVLSNGPGTFLNEFDETIYTYKGDMQVWMLAVIAHHYYEAYYKGLSKEERAENKAKRESKRLELQAIKDAPNSKMVARLAYFKRSYEDKGIPVIYFTEIDDQPLILTKEQVIKINNKWLVYINAVKILNPKQSKKKGVIISEGLSLFVPIKEKYKSDFREAIK